MASDVERGRRRLQRGWLVLVAVGAGAAATLAIAGAPAESSRRPPRCFTDGATILANDVARIYRRGSRTSFVAYGCYYRSGRAVRLSEFDEQISGFRSPRLAGRFLAANEYLCNKNDCADAVGVVDLRSRRNVRGIRPSTRVATTDLEVTRGGSLAVIQQMGTGTGGRSYEVKALVGSGETVLDSGTDIDPESLALSGSRAYWFKGGQARSAELR